MTNTSTTDLQRLTLVSLMEQAIRKDWNNHSDSVFSLSRFEKGLNNRFPEINSAYTIKTAKEKLARLESGKTKSDTFEFFKLERIVAYLFVDHYAVNWENVIRLFFHHEDGAFWDMIYLYTLADDKKMVREFMRRIAPAVSSLTSISSDMRYSGTIEKLFQEDAEIKEEEE